jgi:flagellar protein FlaF
MPSTAQQQGPTPGISAYNKANRSVRSARETERDVIGRITQQLRVANASSDKILRVRAVSDNLSMWYVLMTDLAADENQLPLELRARLLSVGMAVVRECEQPDRTQVGLDFLITVNEALIAGLSDSPAQAAV